MYDVCCGSPPTSLVFYCQGRSHAVLITGKMLSVQLSSKSIYATALANFLASTTFNSLQNRAGVICLTELSSASQTHPSSVQAPAKVSSACLCFKNILSLQLALALIKRNPMTRSETCESIHCSMSESLVSQSTLALIEWPFQNSQKAPHYREASSRLSFMAWHIPGKNHESSAPYDLPYRYDVWYRGSLQWGDTSCPSFREIGLKCLSYSRLKSEGGRDFLEFLFYCGGCGWMGKHLPGGVAVLKCAAVSFHLWKSIVFM